MTRNSFKHWLKEADGDDMLNGVGTVIDTFKKGWDKGKRFGDEIEDNAAANQADVEADKASKDQAALKADINTYIENLFKQFPYHGGAGNPEELMRKYESYASALEAFKSFKGYATQIEKMRKAMNTTLVSQKKLTSEQLKIIGVQTNKIVTGGQLPSSLISFTKKESGFFIRLFKPKDTDFGFDEQNFTSLLSAKMRSTEGARIFDAAMALNMLFAYLEMEFKGHYKYLANVGTQRKKETE